MWPLKYVFIKMLFISGITTLIVDGQAEVSTIIDRLNKIISRGDLVPELMDYYLSQGHIRTMLEYRFLYHDTKDALEQYQINLQQLDSKEHESDFSMDSLMLQQKYFYDTYRISPRDINVNASPVKKNYSVNQTWIKIPDGHSDSNGYSDLVINSKFLLVSNQSIQEKALQVNVLFHLCNVVGKDKIEQFLISNYNTSMEGIITLRCSEFASDMRNSNSTELKNLLKIGAICGAEGYLESCTDDVLVELMEREVEISPMEIAMLTSCMHHLILEHEYSDATDNKELGFRLTAFD